MISTAICMKHKETSRRGEARRPQYVRCSELKWSIIASSQGGKWPPSIHAIFSSISKFSRIGVP